MDLPSKDEINADLQKAADESHVIAAWCREHQLAAGIIAGMVLGLIISWIL